MPTGLGNVDTPDRPDSDHMITWRQRRFSRSSGNQSSATDIRLLCAKSPRQSACAALAASPISSPSWRGRATQRKIAGSPRTFAVSTRIIRRAPEVGIQAKKPGLDIPSKDTAYVPLVGRIAAGSPILSEEAVEAIFPLPKQIVGGGTLFLLKVVGVP